MLLEKGERVKGQLQAQSVPITITKPIGLYLLASEKQTESAGGGAVRGGVNALGCWDPILSHYPVLVIVPSLLI